VLELGAFIFGLLVGSFLNVCIHRLPRDLSVVRPRSFCPACGATIAWYDNIPLMSYLILLGRCRHCRARIPLRYPVVELATGVSFALAVHWAGLSGETARQCVLASILIVLAASDLETRILPDEFTLGGLAAGLAFSWLVPREDGLLRLLFWNLSPRWGSLLESVSAAALLAGMLWAAGFFYRLWRGREGLGLGDVKMIAMMGAFMGLEGALAAMILGSVSGAVLGLAYILWTGQDPRTYPLPYGTFLAMAGLGWSIFRLILF